MTTQLDTLRQALAGRYGIDRILGAGGMATVYLARDLRHDRPVAIKMLQAELTAAIGAERFAREIRLLANLRHPFILPLYDSGEAAGALFYVMAYIDGESLGARIARQGRLPADEAIAIVGQIGDALGYAHSEGVVHRDVKPENILLSRQGHAVLADFGIARKVLPDAGRRDQVTAMGLAIGTPAYMSPEQVFGEDVDGTSDIYSLGATLFQMLTGRPPFVAESTATVASMHLTAPVPSMASHGVAVPPAVEAAVRQALEKDPDDRFHTAADFLQSLRASAATGLTANTGWTAQPTSPSVVAAADTTISVVVLPLTNLSGDQESEYLSDGITDELIGALARVGGLRVISRTSAYAFKGKTVPIREIGDSLKVNFAVEGGVRRSGDRLRVSAQLIRVRDDSSLWSEKYERQLADVFEVQDDITQRIVGTLTKALRLAGIPTPEPIAKPRTLSAYEDYLLGRYHWNKRSKAGLEQALVLFRRAVASDPDYAPAHSGIADALGIMVSGWLAPRDAYVEALASARRAVALDPLLPEGYASLGYLKLHAEWDWAGGEADLRKAIALNPSFVQARQWLSPYLVATGRLAEAVAIAEEATELDPLSILARINLGTIHIGGERYQEAERHFRRAVAMEETFEPAQTWLAICLAFQGRAEAVERGKRAADLSAAPPAARNNAAFIQALLGNKDEAERTLNEVLPSMTPYPLFVAMVYAALGKPDPMFEWLDRAVDARAHWMFSIGSQPTFLGFRSHPRFRALIDRIGLPIGTR